MAALGLATGLARPVLAQNAAAIPVAARVLEVPALRSQLIGPATWLAQAGEGRILSRAGRRALIENGLAALVMEIIEPDSVRVRLEYVAN